MATTSMGGMLMASTTTDVSFRSILFSSSSSSSNTSTRIIKQHQYLFTNENKGLSFVAHGRDFRQLSPQPIYAVNSDIDPSVAGMKNISTTLRKAKVVVESHDEEAIQVRVDLTGKDTQKVFDDVLTNLARTAPAVPGFRKMKGGKMSNVPKDFLVRAIGEARVIKFVIQEIVSTTMTEYVEEKGLKAKKEFKTIQTPEELESLFEPGKDFGFNGTLYIEKVESETTTPSSADV